MARIGKIARLPETIREDLHRKIRNGALGPELLAWLNGMPEVTAVLAEHFAGIAISPQNLSDWRNGGYREWEEKQDTRYQRLEQTRELAAMSVKLAQAAGGNLTEGAAAILGGQILEMLEETASLREQLKAGTDPEQIEAAAKALESVCGSVARLRRGDHDKIVLGQNERKLAQKETELAQAERKFQRDTCSLFLKWAEDQRAREIAATPGDNTARIERLGQLMFGDAWHSDQAAPQG